MEGCNDDTLLQDPLLEQQPANLIDDDNGDPTPPRRRHRNIPVMLAFQFIRCGAESIWLGSVLSAYVYLIKPHKPELIGYLSAVEGIVQFFAACAAGVLADKYRRDILCQVASIFGLAASLLIVGSTMMHIFWFLVVALALNGAFDGINLTAGLAVFADSIQEGKRSHFFTQRTLSMTIGQIMGPLCGLVMFCAMGINGRSNPVLLSCVLPRYSFRHRLCSSGSSRTWNTPKKMNGKTTPTKTALLHPCCNPRNPVTAKP